ncbi:MAG: nucleotide exchange factor GrpE [Lentisphaerae bacterium]|nr:nucleotide exchange factor GrpE [Lentisphaerota bacterium]
MSEKENKEAVAPEAAAENENVSPAEETAGVGEENSETWESQGEVTEENAAAPEAVEVSKEAMLESEVAALKDQLLRKEADFQNYRKRMAREVSDARRIGLIETITPFLQVFDLFEMAMKAADSSDNIAALKQGLAMILGQYGKTLDELGVQKFDAVGSTFDPMLHDAVAYENSEEAADGVILKQWNCGYKLGDRLLRPARVIVSSGPAPEEKAPSEEAAETSADEKSGE